MASRINLVSVLSDLVEWGTQLTDETNRGLAEDRLAEADSLLAFLTVSIHRALKAVHLIAPHHLDDQIVPLARFVVEAGIYVEYVAMPTKRNGLELTRENKVTMFNAAFDDNVQRLHEDGIFKKGDVVFDDVEKAVIRSVKTNRKAIPTPSGMFWHGLTIDGVCDELAAAHESKPDVVRNIRVMQGVWGYLSQGAHPGPNYSATFLPFKIGETPQIVGNCDCDIALAYAVSVGIAAFELWALTISEESQQPAIAAKLKTLTDRLNE